MTDPHATGGDWVYCPGGHVVDRHESLLCKQHPGVNLGDAPPVADPTAETAEGDGEQPVGGGAAGLTANAEAGGWICPSAGCSQTQRISWDVEVCDYCHERRPATLEPPGAAVAARQGAGVYRLCEVSGALEVPLRGSGPWTLGRAQSDSPELAPFDTVSRRHAAIRRGHGALVVTDLHSSNGTYVDGRRLEGDAEGELRPGSILGLGRTVELRVADA